MKRYALQWLRAPKVCGLCASRAHPVKRFRGSGGYLGLAGLAVSTSWTHVLPCLSTQGVFPPCGAVGVFQPFSSPPRPVSWPGLWSAHKIPTIPGVPTHRKACGESRQVSFGVPAPRESCESPTTSREFREWEASKPIIEHGNNMKGISPEPQSLNTKHGSISALEVWGLGFWRSDSRVCDRTLKLQECYKGPGLRPSPFSPKPKKIVVSELLRRIAQGLTEKISVCAKHQHYTELTCQPKKNTKAPRRRAFLTSSTVLYLMSTSLLCRYLL